MSNMSRLDEELCSHQRALAEHIAKVIIRCTAPTDAATEILLRNYDTPSLVTVIETALQQDEPGWIYRALIAESQQVPTPPPSTNVPHNTPQETVGHTPSQPIDPYAPRAVVVIDGAWGGTEARIADSVDEAVRKYPVGTLGCEMYELGREIRIIRSVSYCYGDILEVFDEE